MFCNYKESRGSSSGACGATKTNWVTLQGLNLLHFANQKNALCSYQTNCNWLPIGGSERALTLATKLLIPVFK
jgi:hypothetical protein